MASRSLPKIIFIVSIVINAFAAAIAQGKPVDATSLSLKIAFDGFDQSKSNRKDQACQTFATYLTKNSGLWATGPFQEAACGRASKADLWVLKYRSSDDTSIFELTYHGERAPVVAAQMEFKSELTLQQILQHKTLGKLVAARIATSLPFRSVIPSKRLKSKTILIGRHQRALNVKPPQSLALFELERKDDFWIPRVFAIAAQASLLSHKVAWKNQSMIEQVSDVPLLLFVQQLDGRDKTLAEIDLAIDKLSNKGEGSKQKSLHHSSMGVRYGLMLSPDDPLTQNTPLYGIYCDVRSGFLSGLRIDYDVVPIKVAQTEEGISKWQSTKLQLGYSLSLDLGSDVISRIDVTPRIGLSSFDLSFTASEDSLLPSYAFTLAKSPLAGLEFGLEHRGTFGTLRGWGAGTYSVGILPGNKKSFNVTGLRLGMDAILNAITFDSTSIGFLMFVAYERTIVTQALTEEDIANDPSATAKVEFRTSIVGGGLVVKF